MPVVKQSLPELSFGKGAQTSKGLRRRQLVLEVAASLFAERGFDSVSINEIGFAAEITGPAIYRYFPSKEALLVSIYEQLYRRSADQIDAVLAEGLEGWAAIRRLIEAQVDTAVEEWAKVRIVDRELRHLPLKEAEQLRLQRREFLAFWTTKLREARPDLSKAELDSTVHALLAAINSLTLRRSSDAPSPAVCAHMRRMALSLARAGSRSR